MDCRICGACCIAISISSIIPGTGRPKAAGERCVHLLEDEKCELFDKPERPKVCSEFLAEPLFCGENREEAMEILTKLENS